MRAKMNIRYVNETVVFVHEIKKKIQMVIGGFLTAFFLFGIVGAFTGQIDMKHISVYIVFMIPSVLLLWSGIKTGLMIEAARRFETIFEGNIDGTMTIEEISDYLGKPKYRVINEMETCLKRGYLQNCTLQQGNSSVIIYGPESEEAVIFNS